MSEPAAQPHRPVAVWSGLFARELWFGAGYRLQTPRRGVGCNVYRGGTSHSLGITIEGFTALTEELNLVNPFIRVHLVNTETGNYVRSLKRNNKFILPVSSKVSSKNDHSADKWSWSQDRLTLNCTFNEAVSKENVLLFEVLDMKSSLRLRTNGDQQGNPMKVKRVGWAFLLPVGGGETKDDPEHCNVGLLPEWTKSASQQSSGRSSVRKRAADVGKENRDAGNDKGEEPEVVEGDAATSVSRDIKAHLQLHLFKADGPLEALQRSSLGWPRYTHEVTGTDDLAYLNDIPEVYLQWRRARLAEVPSALKVSLGPAALHPDFCEVELGDAPIVGDQPEDQAQDSSGSPSKAAVRPKDSSYQYRRNLSKEMVLQISKRSRTEIENCLIPDTLLHKVDIGPAGAMSLAFAHGGVFLAVAGESSLEADSAASGERCRAKVHGLHLIDSDTGKIAWSDLRAHHGVVYQLRWALNDSWLLSASADGSVKVWDTAGIVGATTNNTKTPHYMPYQLYTVNHSPPDYIYCALFQEYSLKPGAALPRILTGSHDGRIRVYQEATYLGQLGFKESAERGEADIESSPAPHTGYVNDLCIDCKSKNLFSADSVGSILVWRLDPKGWYRILRKLKTEQLGITNVSSLSLLSVLNLQRASLANAHSQQMLVLSAPKEMTVFNTSTYRSNLGGFPAVNIPREGPEAVQGLVRSSLSADGRLAICGSVKQRSGATENILRVWDATTGNGISATLSSLKLPYIARAVAWHPTQHVIAVALVGPGAAVSLYYANREKVTLNADSSKNIIHSTAEVETQAEGIDKDEEDRDAVADKGNSRDESRKNSRSKDTPVAASSPSNASRLNQARDIMAKMRTSAMSRLSPKVSFRK